MNPSLDEQLARLAHRYPGPGGAAAIVHNGALAASHAWGWANTAERLPFSARSLFRICSITKQMTCATALSLFPDVSELDAGIRARLPRLQEPAPSALQLCHNQSGLRDYWAQAMLQGASVEGVFGDTEAARLLDNTRRLHFPPGMRYSYANQNFRLLADTMQEHTGTDFAELLGAQVFERAGMPTARLVADTSSMPGHTQGYEGTPSTGFRAANNRIVWTGDAGIAASLEDLIAYERWIDAGRDDPASLYNRLSAPTAFADGTPAAYGFGLQHRVEAGRLITGHGGALRGWRSHRWHMPSERLSVIVLFNHMSDAQSAATELLRGFLGAQQAPAPDTHIVADWLGDYLEPETGVAVRFERASAHQVRMRFAHFVELLDVRIDGAGNPATRIHVSGEGICMHRLLENQRTLLQRLTSSAEVNIAGSYHCEETDSLLQVSEAGGILYGSFSGFLGQSPMELLEPLGCGVWNLPCLRALDAPAPAAWTLQVQAVESGRARSLRVGCVLARNYHFQRFD